MFIVCWSPKGGSGTSVVAAALAIQAAAEGRESLLVDLVGDQPAILAAPLVEGTEGIGDWLAAGADVPFDALRSLETEVSAGLSLLPRGTVPESRCAERLALAASVFGSSARTVVVDAGVGRPDWLVAGCSVAVVRGCYLGLRKLVVAVEASDHVALIEEPGRSLGRRDVESALGRSVTSVPWDPAVARAVDAGVLPHRLPRSLRALRPLVAR